jgi:large subunit ribosomal protein L29
MKAEKIRGIDAADLTRQVHDAQEQLFRIRFQMGMGQNEGLKKYRALKKDRARMLTVLREMGVTVVAQAALPAKAPAGRKLAAKTKRGLGGLFGRKKK